MSNPDNGGPAFPTIDSYEQIPGLSKREWFAGMAMQGFCANPEFSDAQYEKVAEHAIKQTDAMLAEIKKGQSDE